jgi:PAS domain S-box-containing protein
MMEIKKQTSVMAEFATFLQREHLEAVYAESLRLSRAYDLPLLKLFAHMSDAELIEMGKVGMATFLSDLAEGRALAAYEETLRLWEQDALPGVPRDAVQPADMVLAYAAQKQAILAFLPRFTSDPAQLMAVVQELEDYYVQAQNAALHIFDRLRARAVERATRAETEHRAAMVVAEELRASEGRLRELANAMPQQVWTATPDGQLDYVNDQVAAYAGQPVASLLGEGWAMMLHPDDVAPTVEKWRVALAAGTPYEVTFRLRRSEDASYRWHMGRALPVRDAAGRVVRWYGTNTDVHERATVERALQDANEQLEAQTEELRAANEEQATQAEELASQQEELNALYEELRRHADQVEAKVSERTQELQAANEELAAQSEELAFQAEELQRINEEIERAHNLLHGVLNNLPGAVGYCDKDLVIRLVNAPYAAQLGVTPEQIQDRAAKDVFAEHFPLIEGPLRQVIDTGEPWRAFSQPAGDGSTFVDFVVVPVRDRAGRVEGLLSLSFDATERVRLEQEVAARNDEVLEQKRLVESIIAHAPAGVVYMDRDMTVRWVNPEYTRLVERPMDHFIGRTFLEGASPEVRAEIGGKLEAVIATGTSHQAAAYPYTLTQHGVPKQTYWDFNYVPVRGREGEVEGVLVFTLEVSSRVENERLQQERIQQLQQTDRYKDEFISVISHELRTPLNFIMGFASLLEDEVPGAINAAQREHVAKILHGADRMLALVDDLLDFARIRAGSFSLAPELTAYDALIEDTVGTVRPLAEQKGLRLETACEKGLLTTVDVQRVTQVLTNLLSNAIKFTERDGAVRVRTYVDGDWITTEVADTGVGIAPEDLPKLFQRFQQLDMSATRKAGGTGLGLSIAKALVEAHGGVIGVKSELGEGSTFYYSLPRVAVEV